MSTHVNRRRSQRLFLQIRVIVEGHIGGDSNFTENTYTVVVNANGALVDLSAAPEQGQTLTLMNCQTNEKQESKVILVSAGDSGKFSVALEFTTPNPLFWSVSFPSDDWSIRYPDAKRNP